MIQLAWRFLLFQKDSALAQWYRTRTEGGRNRKTIIVALARKLLIALWRLVPLARFRLASYCERREGEDLKDKLSEADEQNIVSVR
jgi:hypothetical protein